jgi:hypothetical protein
VGALDFGRRFGLPLARDDAFQSWIVLGSTYPGMGWWNYLTLFVESQLNGSIQSATDYAPTSCPAHGTFLLVVSAIALCLRSMRRPSRLATATLPGQAIVSFARASFYGCNHEPSFPPSCSMRIH